jgi:molybdopterin converting factor small subunit
MNLTINALGSKIVLKQEISLEPASSTLKDVLRALQDRYGTALGPFVKDDLTPTEGSVILVNGRNIESLERFETRIREGDEITFTVLVAGG